jgi:hypothetical protein
MHLSIEQHARGKVLHCGPLSQCCVDTGVKKCHDMISLLSTALRHKLFVVGYFAYICIHVLMTSVLYESRVERVTGRALGLIRPGTKLQKMNILSRHWSPWKGINKSQQECLCMKNGVFWDVTPCGSCKNRRFGGT